MRISVVNLPDVKLNAAPPNAPRANQPLTTANLLYVMNAMELTLRFNMMLQKAVYALKGDVIDDDKQGLARQGLRDALKNMDITGLADFEPMVQELALQDRFHPMEDWLASLPPPVGDPIGDLIASVNAPGEMWPIAMETWLVQVVEAVCGWHGWPKKERPIPYCLVLQGGQGIGKTQFFRNLGGVWAKTEAEVQTGSSTNAEESQLRALRFPIVELAELDAITRKQDVAELKAFLTRPTDDLRRKYAHAALPMPRMSALGGTVNIGAFLNDPTGTRRFMPVGVESIDWDAKIDYEGVWAAAYAIWQEHGFEMLTDEEEKIRDLAAQSFFHASPEVEMLESHWADYGEYWDCYFALTCTQITQVLGLNHNSRGTTAAVREWMTKEYGKEHKIMGRKHVWAVPVPQGMQAMARLPPALTEALAKKHVRWGT